MQANCKPLPHQREGIKFIEEHNGRCLIADDMGLGKSVQALGYLYRNPSALPAVIVCPAAVKYNWEHEALKHFGVHASICEGETPPLPSEIGQTPPITIINSDILTPKARHCRAAGKSWVQYLLKLRPKTLIVDECQMLASLDSKRTANVEVLSKAVPHVLMMSGTPIQNTPQDLYPLAEMLWPGKFGTFDDYAWQYCDPQWRPWGWDLSGASNLEELHGRLKQLGLLRRTEDILDLPEKKIHITPIQMRDEEQYRLAQLDFMEWIKQHKAHKLKRVKKHQRLSQVGYLLRLAAQLKMRNCVAWGNQFLRENPGEKLVLFGYHTPVIRYLQDNIEAKSIVIDGSVTGRTRQEQIWQFQNDPQTRFCAAQLKAGSVGINLTAAATLGIVELWHNPSVLDQAIKRIHRIGQHKPVNIHYLIARGSIEERMCSMLQRKKNAATAIIDGGRVNDFNLYDSLLNELKGGLLK